MGYHSADYNKDWKIDLAELLRVISIYNTTNVISGDRTGCYKVDNGSIDGFASDPTRTIDEPIVLERYHSADYNRDGRIDDAELARVQELYNYSYQDIYYSSTVRTGEYHDYCPTSIDGFGLGPVQLNLYQFDDKHLPIISTKIVPDNSNGTVYKLRLKFIDLPDAPDLQATEQVNNNNYPIETIPAPGVYRAALYWVRYAPNGWEGDVNNDGKVDTSDVTEINSIISGLSPIPTGSAFMRADCAPRSTKGNGIFTSSDAVQANRYKLFLDPPTVVGGPGTPDEPPFLVPWQIGGEQIVDITIGEERPNCNNDINNRDCICGPKDEPPPDPDKGNCFPYRTKRTCEAPALPEAPCNDDSYYTIYDPSSPTKFKVIAKLLDSSCQSITDSNDNPILTTLS
jgi:hypothetical protein